MRCVGTPVTASLSYPSPEVETAGNNMKMSTAATRSDTPCD